MVSDRLGYNRSIGLDGFPLAPARGGVQKARRYDGAQKSSRSWDCLRRDEELWLEDGDCLVHLYGPGKSRRGASFKVPFKVVEESRSRYLLEQCPQKSDPSSPTSSTSEDDSSDSGYGASICSDSGSEKIELYVRAPSDIARKQAFQYHVGTRNFFAYLLHKPLVGESLGKALAELASRIELWQTDGAASTAFLDYCQEQGYLDFAENPDYAAASLYLADQARIKDIWVDAFAHCVGMRDDVENSPEAEALSHRTKALISRASLEMELHIVRVTRALSVFLEEELGPEHLGISKPLRNHLDRFRSSLHAHYVSLFGYFPPDESARWHKQLWVALFEDFRNLYEYLADTQSSDDRSSIRGVNGGICVLQNVNAFDARHGYLPLPHPLPLLPEAPSIQPGLAGEVMHKGLRSFRLGRSEAQQPPQTIMTPKEALARASNTSNPAVLSNRLVQEYIRFERAKLEERVSVSEARKVRWILVYSVLQMLISVTRAPTEVQDTENPSYPLCVLTTGCPAWIDPTMNTTTQEIQQHAIELEGRLSVEMDSVRRTMETDRISIHPDCEADNADDYFMINNTTGGLSRSASDVSLGNMMPSPLRTGSYISRRASLRSGVTSLQRSVVGSFGRRNSARRASLALATTPIQEAPTPFCEILIEGYGNGSTDFDTSMDAEKPLHGTHTPLAELEAPWPHAIPTLELHQIHLVDDEDYERSPAESQKSRFSTVWSDFAEDPESSSSEVSSPGAGNEENKTNNFSAFSFDFDMGQTHAPLETYQARRSSAVNAGTYIPTGSAVKSALPPITIPTRTTSRVQSSDSIVSMASSCYGDDNVQAAEIAEEEVRGRTRLRGRFGVVKGGISLPVSPI